MGLLIGFLASLGLWVLHFPIFSLTGWGMGPGELKGSSYGHLSASLSNASARRASESERSRSAAATVVVMFKVRLSLGCIPYQVNALIIL